MLEYGDVCGGLTGLAQRGDLSLQAVLLGDGSGALLFGLVVRHARLPLALGDLAQTDQHLAFASRRALGRLADRADLGVLLAIELPVGAVDHDDHGVAIGAHMVERVALEGDRDTIDAGGAAANGLHADRADDAVGDGPGTARRGDRTAGDVDK